MLFLPPRLSAWIAKNLAEGFTVFDFSLEHRRMIRTINSLEQINKEIRRRTKVVDVFPNEASYLRLISALLMEISEEWQIGNITLLANHSTAKELWVFLAQIYRKLVT